MARVITEIKPIPENLALEKIMEVATTPDAAVYYVEGYRKILLSQGRPIDPELEKALTQFIEDVEVIRGQGGAGTWDGHPDLRSAFALVQAKILENKLKVTGEFFKNENNTVDMYYSVGEQSEFARFYAIHGDALMGDNLDTMDVALNAWFSLKNWRSVDGVVYELNESKTDGRGEIKRDEKTHEKIRANPEEVAKELNEHFVPYAKAMGITMGEINRIKEEPTAAAAPQ
jgi:hypothetical protein